MGDNGGGADNAGKAGATGDGNGERLARSKLRSIASHGRNRCSRSHDFGTVAKATARNAWGGNSTEVDLSAGVLLGRRGMEVCDVKPRSPRLSGVERHRRVTERGRGGGRAFEHIHRH